MIVRGKDATLWDARGNRYLDAMAGLWCVNVGYGRTEIADAVAAQIQRLSYYHGFSSMATDTPALLAERVLALSPVAMSKVFFGNSGSDANDTQAKLIYGKVLWGYLTLTIDKNTISGQTTEIDRTGKVTAGDSFSYPATPIVLADPKSVPTL